VPPRASEPAEAPATFSPPARRNRAPRRADGARSSDSTARRRVASHRPASRAHRTAARHQATPVVRTAARQRVGSAARPTPRPRPRPTWCPVRSAAASNATNTGPETPPKLTPHPSVQLLVAKSRGAGSRLVPSSEAVARDDQAVAVVEHSVEHGGGDRSHRRRRGTTHVGNRCQRPTVRAMGRPRRNRRHPPPARSPPRRTL
jgi:hypothetical protein